MQAASKTAIIFAALMALALNGCGDEEADDPGTETPAAADADAGNADAPEDAEETDADDAEETDGEETDGEETDATGAGAPVAGSGSIGGGTTCDSLSEPRSTEENACSAFFCDTDQATLEAESTVGGACTTGIAPKLVCNGASTRVTAACARANAFAFDPGMASKECLMNPPADLADAAGNIPDDIKSDVQMMPSECMDCYIESALCAREFCLGDCLAGDNPTCDACREDNGCTPGFYACGGLPDPNA